MIQKLHQYGFFKYGEVIPGLQIHGMPAPYPVLNERAIRATAGIMLALAFFGFSNAFFDKNLLPLKIVVVLFFIDFFTKVILGTKFSVLGKMGAFIVRNQEPEYVGAIQKRFAWSIGLLLSSIMILLLFVFQVTGPINLAICSICLTVMWFETSFGICIGCKLYYGLIKLGVLKAPQIRPACPGGVCSIQRGLH